MADSHSTLVTKPHLSGGRNEERQSQTVHRRVATRRGEPSSPPDLEPRRRRSEQFRACLSRTPFGERSRPRDGAEPFRRWSMNRSLRFLSVLMTGALVMAACGGGGGSAAPTSGGGASAPATAAGSAPAGSAPAVSGAITVTSLWGGSEQENFQKVLDAFTAKTGIKVTYESIRTNYATVLQTRISGGNPPDVSILPGIGFLRHFAKDGSIK